MVAVGLDAIWLIPDPIVLKYRQNVSKIFEAASAQRKAIFTYAKFDKYDAVLILTAKISTIGKQMAADDVKKNLKTGKCPDDEKVQFPSDSRVFFNKSN